MSRKNGIGNDRGMNLTSLNYRNNSQRYKVKHDRIHVSMPLGTRDRIKSTGMKPIDFYREAIEFALAKENQ